MKVKANGIAMNYQVDGPEGAPWLIFSNSLATNLTMWDDQARELKHAYRVLRYDQRGHGGTEATAGRYSFDLLLADVIALMDALAIKKAHFAGLSMGGATALGLAQKHPDRLDRGVSESDRRRRAAVHARMGGRQVRLADARDHQRRNERQRVLVAER